MPGARPIAVNPSTGKVYYDAVVTPAIQQATVTTSAVRLDQALASTAGSAAGVFRNRGTAAVYLGPSTVLTSTGFQLDPGESVSLPLDAFGASGIYGIAASGSHRVDCYQAGA